MGTVRNRSAMLSAITSTVYENPNEEISGVDLQVLLDDFNSSAVNFQTDRPFLNLQEFSAGRGYILNECTVRASIIYQCTNALGHTGAWNPSNFAAISDATPITPYSAGNGIDLSSNVVSLSTLSAPWDTGTGIIIGQSGQAIEIHETNGVKIYSDGLALQAYGDVVLYNGGDVQVGYVWKATSIFGHGYWAAESSLPDVITAGTFTNANITVNTKGQITAASNGSSGGSTYTFNNGLTLATGNVTNDLITGKSGGQTVIGGTGSGNGLTLSSTNHTTKGPISFGASIYNEVNDRLGIKTTSPSYDISIGGVSDRTIGIERQTTAATVGRDLFIRAGGAVVGGTDLSGGYVNIIAGISTGAASAGIRFYGNKGASAGTADASSVLRANMNGNGAWFFTNTLQIADSTQALDRMYMCDASGNGKWVDRSVYTLPKFTYSSTSVANTDTNVLIGSIPANAMSGDFDKVEAEFVYLIPAGTAGNIKFGFLLNGVDVRNIDQNISANDNTVTFKVRLERRSGNRLYQWIDVLVQETSSSAPSPAYFTTDTYANVTTAYTFTSAIPLICYANQKATGRAVSGHYAKATYYKAI